MDDTPLIERDSSDRVLATDRRTRQRERGLERRIAPHVSLLFLTHSEIKYEGRGGDTREEEFAIKLSGGTEERRRKKMSRVDTFNNMNREKERWEGY